MVLGSVLISFLYVWLSSFPSTIYWRGCLCPIVYSCLLYKNKVSIGALVYFWAFYLVPLVFRASLVAQRVKHLLATRETWVWFLGREDPLEKEIATHSSTLAWKIPWMEKPGRLQSMGSQRVGHDWATSLSFFSTGLYICFCASTILPWWLWKSEVRKVDSSTFILLSQYCFGYLGSFVFPYELWNFLF